MHADILQSRQNFSAISVVDRDPRVLVIRFQLTSLLSRILSILNPKRTVLNTAIARLKATVYGLMHGSLVHVAGQGVDHVNAVNTT
jgi:hypothetical protein